MRAVAVLWSSAGCAIVAAALWAAGRWDAMAVNLPTLPFVLGLAALLTVIAGVTPQLDVARRRPLWLMLAAASGCAVMLETAAWTDTPDVQLDGDASSELHRYFYGDWTRLTAEGEASLARLRSRPARRTWCAPRGSWSWTTGPTRRSLLSSRVSWP